MKRLILLLTLIFAFQVAADAQFAIGGNFSLKIDKSNKSEVVQDVLDYTGNDFSVMLRPKFYYNIKDNMQVGLKVGCYFGREVENWKYSEYDSDAFKDVSDFMGWGISPFYNLKVYSYSKVSIWVEANLFFDKYYNEGTEANLFNQWKTQAQYGFEILPIFSWELNDRYSLDIHLGFISLGWVGVTEHYDGYDIVESSWDIRKGGFDGLIRGFSDYGIGLTRRF